MPPTHFLALQAPVVELEGLGTFRDQVLFLGARKDEGLERVREVAAAARAALQDIGLQGGGGGAAFAPHVTIAKLSKVPWRRGQPRLRSIPREAWGPCADVRGGSVTLSAVQLCRMRLV
ncbi:hypothetical protein WJX81_003299 [Elliptochloris bilobata]|uniref:A-kinase anchor protein 7-like phosphoesterase domain-containing protein n=1 Tax=Elliptochloris bilobata TaxID=381761 RepID=A0AAW1SA54_9CHLO